MIFGKLVLSSRTLRILTEYIEMKKSFDSKLQIDCICSVRILNILDVIAKTSISKIANCSTLGWMAVHWSEDIGHVSCFAEKFFFLFINQTLSKSKRNKA